jgi:hypothetical protein
MQNCNTLRIDPTDGSRVTEYRIDGDHVQSREVHSDDAGEWKQVTPQQLTSHVLANTVVAYWLRRRMGLHQLVRACAMDSSAMEFEEDQLAA